MEKKRIKSTLNMIACISMFVTICVIVLTLLTTYKRVEFKFFNNYKAVQLSLAFTMFVGSFTIFDKRRKKQSIFFIGISLLIAIGSMVFYFIPDIN